MKKSKKRLIKQDDIAVIKTDICYIKQAVAWLIGIITTTAFTVFGVCIWFGNIQNATAQNSSDIKDLKHIHYAQPK